MPCVYMNRIDKLHGTYTLHDMHEKGLSQSTVHPNIYRERECEMVWCSLGEVYKFISGAEWWSPLYI